MTKLKLCKYFQTPVSYLLKIVSVISDEEIGKETLWLRLMFGSTETENKLNYVKNLFRKQLNILSCSLSLREKCKFHIIWRSNAIEAIKIKVLHKKKKT